MGRKNTIYITWGGETHTAGEWEEITGIPRDTILSRRYYGWSPEEMLTVPPGSRRPDHDKECHGCKHRRELSGTDGFACHYALDTGRCRTAYKGTKIERCERKRAAMAAAKSR